MEGAYFPGGHNEDEWLHGCSEALTKGPRAGSATQKSNYPNQVINPRKSTRWG